MGENSLEPALPLALSLSLACQLDFFMGVILIDVCLCISLAGTILACKTFAVSCCSIFFCICACFLYPIQLKADSGKNFHYEIGSLSIWLGKKRFCRRGGSEEGKTPRALGYYGYYFASLKICRADS